MKKRPNYKLVNGKWVQQNDVKPGSKAKAFLAAIVANIKE